MSLQKQVYLFLDWNCFDFIETDELVGILDELLSLKGKHVYVSKD